MKIRGQYLNNAAEFADADAFKAAFSVINNFVMGLFKSMNLTMNGKIIEENQDVYRTTTILGLAKFSKNYLETEGSNLYFTIEGDTAAYDAGDDDAAKAVKDRENPRNVAIQEWVGTTGKFSSTYPLEHIFGFCKDVDKVFNGVNYNFGITRNPNDFSLASGAGANSKFKIEELQNIMPIVHIKTDYEISLMKDIKENRPFEILFNPYDVYKQSFNINPINWVINITQEKPNHIFIAYQTGDEGALATNNGVFNGGRIIEAYLSINAVRIPSFDLQTNFSEEEKM